MSTNEVNNIQAKMKAYEKNVETQEVEKKQEIDVFGSSEVSAKVNLKADENNSLFNKVNYLKSEDTPETMLPQRLGAVGIPKEIKDKYSAEELESFKDLSAEQLNEVKKLMTTKLSAQNIAEIVTYFNPKQVDTIKTRTEELQESLGGYKNVYAVALGRDSYDQEAFNLKGLSFDSELQSEILDKNLNMKSVEVLKEMTTTDGKMYREKNANDLRNKTMSKIRYDYDKKLDTFVSSYELRSKLNENNEMISREYSRPSDIKGVFTVDVLTEDGLKKVSNAKTRKNGNIKIKKDLVSLDGTKTKYIYKDTPEGDRAMRYKITTADGEVLMDNKKTFKVISENEFESTFNDKKHSMVIKDNVLTVTDTNNPENTATFKLDEIKGNKDSLIKILKRMSGEELIALKNSTNSLVGIDNILDSYYMPKDKSLHSGDDMFVVLHELGHAKDFKNIDANNNLSYFLTMGSMISKNPELKETFEKEKAAFNKAFPDAQREHIDYFINTLTHYNGESGGIQETVAEGNAINSSPLSHELLAMRTEYLQHYYPRTMAKLNDLFLAQSNNKQTNKPIIK